MCKAQDLCVHATCYMWLTEGMAEADLAAVVSIDMHGSIILLWGGGEVKPLRMHNNLLTVVIWLPPKYGFCTVRQK